ncbi:hypothetical protein LGQ02_08925 [Bacillus shivajii]|uniref:hypothetical protein n=1 Tax=Bacillus shivajii TaxID=1983719 RepID=UPI001CFB0CB0|nr:hypothetical protein [Bacillus shivajii]UCZ54848.1 hypothetical protein LGQ02_08925 [Bacillus shivajii]
MSWRDNLLEQKWLEPFLPNYLKPLKDPDIKDAHTETFVQEAIEFISDLSSLSELPRLNKTFKREILGYLFKVKIKQKKIHLELIDTKKSSAKLKKRVYLTVYRKQFKEESGMGKVADSTIYYQKEGRTIVRNVRNHSLFSPLFIAVNKLDESLSGKNGKALPPTSISEEVNHQQDETESVKHDILSNIKAITSQSNSQLDSEIQGKLLTLQSSIDLCVKEIHLFDIEEKHQIKRLINRDLPNLLETYEQLTPEQRQAKYEELTNTVNAMITFVNDLKNQINDSRMDRMEHLLRLNRIRYEQKKDAD